MRKVISMIAVPVQFIRTLVMLLGMLVQRPQPETQRVVEPGVDYDNMLKQPTAELFGRFQPVFCPTCHVLVAQTRRTSQGTEIVQNGRKLITVGNNITTDKNGKKQSGFPIRCLNGHAVVITSQAKEAV